MTSDLMLAAGYRFTGEERIMGTGIKKRDSGFARRFPA
jgi:hypothetical protein